MDNADKSIGTISVWDETYEGWLLSSEGCKPGATGYIHAEKDGKHYALPVIITGQPTSAYTKIPDVRNLADGYIPEQNIRGTNIRGQSRWNMKKVKDHPKWPWSVFEMTYKNDEGGTEDFRVQTNDYTLVFHYTEK